MTYSVPIVIEQGGSIMNVASTGSIVIASGGTQTISGTQTIAGTQTVSSGGSISVAAGGRFGLGNSNFEFGADLPTHLASPGTVYFRSDGSISNIYCNISAGSSGSVWKGASLFVS